MSEMKFKWDEVVKRALCMQRKNVNDIQSGCEVNSRGSCI